MDVMTQRASQLTFVGVMYVHRARITLIKIFFNRTRDLGMAIYARNTFSRLPWCRLSVAINTFDSVFMMFFIYGNGFRIIRG